MKVYRQTVQAEALPQCHVPESCNYIAIFLTLHCNYRCSYCINRYSDLVTSGRALSAAEWLHGLNRLQSRPDLPITLQGGEPSLHPGFYEIINGIRPDLNIDLLTNLQFDVDTFMKRVPASRLRRDAPYASIRVSYHPETMNLNILIGKVVRLMSHGYSVGIWAVDHPAWQKDIEQARTDCGSAGIDFRTKEFLGEYGGELLGSYSFRGALSKERNGPVECRTSELLIDPEGGIHRCHSDLYTWRSPLGSILDPFFQVEDCFRFCDNFGFCNPCDVKIKTNRFQQSGHTSVDIRFPGDR